MHGRVPRGRSDGGRVRPTAQVSSHIPRERWRAARAARRDRARNLRRSRPESKPSFEECVWLAAFLQPDLKPGSFFLEEAMAALRTLVAMLMLCCSAMAFQAAPLRSSAPSRAAASSISVRHYPSMRQRCRRSQTTDMQACGPPSLPGAGRLHRR